MKKMMKEKESKKMEMAEAKGMKGGAMPAPQYAAAQGRKMADGGMCGYRSSQDYGKK